MLTFAIFDPDGSPSKSFKVRHAHLFGAEDVPVQGAVRFEAGAVVCEPSIQTACGLCLQFPVHAAGREAVLTLQTCLLPEREEPYLLSLELARHQIMLFLNKLEDWDLFEVPGDHPVVVEFDQARQMFMKALVIARGAGASLSEADRLAREALVRTIDAGERLALLQAEFAIPRRASNRAYLDATNHYTTLTGDSPAPGVPIAIPGAGHVVLSGVGALGVTVSPGPMSENLQRYIVSNCDFLTLPMRWVDLEPEEGEYVFTATDRWIEWAVRTAKLPLVGGPLIDFRPTCVPEWLYIWENDYETLRELVFEHVQTVVTRYRRTIGRWNVVSGLHANNYFRLTLEQVMDLTRIAVLLVRKLQPQARIGIEIAQPWGEYYATTRKSIPPIAYAETLVQANVPFEVIGLRIQMGQPAPGQTQRDLMTFSALLDRYAALEKPLAVTCIGAPAAPLAPASLLARASAPTEDAEGRPSPLPPAFTIDPGVWFTPWTDAAQADFLTQAMAIAAAKPFVQSVCWQELIDPPRNPPEMPGGGLFTATGAARPAASRLGQLRQWLREGKAPAVPPARL